MRLLNCGVAELCQTRSLTHTRTNNLGNTASVDHLSNIISTLVCWASIVEMDSSRQIPVTSQIECVEKVRCGSEIGGHGVSESETSIQGYHHSCGHCPIINLLAKDGKL